MKVNVNEIAPQFTAVNQNNEMVSLSDFLGKKVVLYFYPKDSTSGCTNQANEFKRLYAEFNNKNTVIIGVSRDSVKSHQRFIEKNELPFMLLSDSDEVVCNLYGVIQEKKLYGKVSMGIVRSTFIIDEAGVVVSAVEKVNSKNNAQETCELI